jgi:hypothetical protein
MRIWIANSLTGCWGPIQKRLFERLNRWTWSGAFLARLLNTMNVSCDGSCKLMRGIINHILHRNHALYLICRSVTMQRTVIMTYLICGTVTMRVQNLRYGRAVTVTVHCPSILIGWEVLARYMISWEDFLDAVPCPCLTVPCAVTVSPLIPLYPYRPYGNRVVSCGVYLNHAVYTNNEQQKPELPNVTPFLFCCNNFMPAFVHRGW